MAGRESQPEAEPAGWTARAGDLVQPRDPIFLELGPGGELIASRARLAVTLGLLFAANTVAMPALDRGPMLGAAGAGLALAVVVHAWVSWCYRAWLPYVTVVVDVLLAAALVALVRLHVPDASTVTLGASLVVLALAALRYRPSLVVEAGALLASLQVVWVGLDGAVLAALGLATALLAAVLARGRRRQELADIDPLTGLLRRETFDVCLRDELARSQRHGHRATLALIEVDQFRGLASRYGAARSAAVQRSISGTLRRAVRGTDVLSRYGSGLFALMFPETDARASLNRLEQLRRAVGLESSGGAGPDSGAGVTVSVGVAAWPDDAADAIVLMTVAEQRLHEARAAGHDRLVGPG